MGLPSQGISLDGVLSQALTPGQEGNVGGLRQQWGPSECSGWMRPLGLQGQEDFLPLWSDPPLPTHPGCTFSEPLLRPSAALSSFSEYLLLSLATTAGPSAPP